SLVDSSGCAHEPLRLAVAAQAGQRLPLFAGLRPTGPSRGYLLEPLSSASFGRQGLRLPVDADMAAACCANGSAPRCEVGLFQLCPEACRQDLRRLLGHLARPEKAVALEAEAEEETLGALMFTCCGRRAQFFGKDHVDLAEFKAAFPGKPLVGFWANGEIGPQALAQAAPEEATRTGRAALQGFTAVFGVFRAPRPARRPLDLADPADLVRRHFAALLEVAQRRGEVLKQGGKSAAETAATQRVLQRALGLAAAAQASAQAELAPAGGESESW
ncbi:unnamed protein product, partial [Effrenium voratum]